MNNHFEEGEQTSPVSEPVALSLTEEELRERLKAEQDLPRGIVPAAAAAVVSAIVWALITIGTGYQIGIMAIGVGLLVGLAMRKGGKGIDPIFGIAGATLAFLACLLGNFFGLVGIGADIEGLGYFETLSMVDIGAVSSLMFSSPIDFLFYGLAIYEGYKFSFRRITEDEVAGYAT